MLLALFWLGLSPFSDRANARVLNWEDCVKSVSENNPDLASARDNTRSASAQVGSSWYDFYPSVTGSVNANHALPNQFNPLLYAAPGVSYSSALTLNYNLFNGFKDVATVESAKASLNVSHATLDGTRAAISDALRQAFIKLKYAESYVKLTASIIDRRTQNERMIRSQYESGTENQGSYLLSQSDLEQSKFDHLQAIHQEIFAREALAHVLGDNDYDITLTGAPPRTSPPEDPNLRDLTLITPAHRIQSGQVDIARANIKLTDAGFYPNLNFTASLQNSDGILYANNDQQWSIGLALTIPLFTGLSTYYSAKSARYLEKAAIEVESYSDFSTQENLQQALFNFQESVELLRVDELSLNALKIQEKIATKQYNNGLMTFENWDIIENNLVTAEKTMLSADEKRDLHESSYRLAQGLGDL